MEKKREFHFLKTVSTCFGVIVAVVGLTWIVWQASSSNHRVEINSLRQTLKSVAEAYETLAQKTEGLLEPQLLSEGTLRFEKSEGIYLHGGRLRFSVWVWKQRDLIDIDYENRIDSLKVDDLRLQPGERFDFEVSGRRYYIAFFVLDPTDTLVVYRVYELNPIYRPVEGFLRTHQE